MSDLEMCVEAVPKAGCVVVNPFGQVLVVDERNGDVGLPKGHLEAGETFTQTAVRETFEETGYVVALEETLGNIKYTSSFTGDTVYARYFRATPLYWEGPGEVPAYWVEPHAAQLLVNQNVIDFVIAASEAALHQPRLSLSTVALAHAL